MELEKDILNAIRNSVASAIKSCLEGYSSPLLPIIKKVIEENDSQIRGLIGEAISGVFVDAEFRDQMIQQIRHKVARELTQNFGEGIFKKTIDNLKSDPTTKARCVMAIESIVQAEMEKLKN